MKANTMRMTGNTGNIGAKTDEPAKTEWETLTHIHELMRHRCTQREGVKTDRRKWKVTHDT